MGDAGSFRIGDGERGRGLARRIWRWTEGEVESTSSESDSSPLGVKERELSLLSSVFETFLGAIGALLFLP